MRLVSYRPRAASRELRGFAGLWRAGVMYDDRVVDVADISPHSTGQTTTKQLLTAGPASLRATFDLARAAFAETIDAPGASIFAADSIELGPPVPDPDKIICIGVNYADHAREAGLAQTPVPVFFAKFRNSLTGPTSSIRLPKVSSQIDYEGELAVIIGARCRDVPEHDALQYVAGYSLMNDVSARDLQMRTSQWTAGKALDTFAPMGPGMVLAADIPDPQALTLTTRVNGQVTQHASTGSMIFSVAAIIAFLSSLMTLEPGDIIATGTPSGVGFMRTPPLFLRAGDLVEIEIEEIGHLRNPVASAEE